jgi:predicted nucleic acid-binding protein
VRYVLDSNIAIAALNRVDAVRSRLVDVPGSEVGIPIVAIAELTFGAYKSKRREANIAKIAALRRSITVLDLGDGVVDLYGSTRAALEARGIVRSDFDLIIACTALDQDAVLVTNDRGLLDAEIDGLRVENWLASGAPD